MTHYNDPYDPTDLTTDDLNDVFGEQLPDPEEAQALASELYNSL